MGKHRVDVLADASGELRGDASDGVFDVRGSLGGGGGDAPAVAGVPPLHAMEALVVDPGAEGLVEEGADDGVSHGDEYAVRAHASVLFRGLLDGGAERDHAHLGVRRRRASEADFLRLELRLSRVNRAQAAGAAARRGGRGVVRGVRRPRSGRSGPGRHLHRLRGGVILVARRSDVVDDCRGDQI